MSNCKFWTIISSFHLFSCSSYCETSGHGSKRINWTSIYKKLKKREKVRGEANQTDECYETTWPGKSYPKQFQNGGLPTPRGEEKHLLDDCTVYIKQVTTQTSMLYNHCTLAASLIGSTSIHPFEDTTYPHRAIFSSTCFSHFLMCLACTLSMYADSPARHLTQQPCITTMRCVKVLKPWLGFQSRV